MRDLLKSAKDYTACMQVDYILKKNINKINKQTLNLNNFVDFR